MESINTMRATNKVGTANRDLFEHRKDLWDHLYPIYS